MVLNPYFRTTILPIFSILFFVLKFKQAENRSDKITKTDISTMKYK